MFILYEEINIFLKVKGTLLTDKSLYSNQIKDHHGGTTALSCHCNWICRVHSKIPQAPPKHPLETYTFRDTGSCFKGLAPIYIHTSHMHMKSVTAGGQIRDTQVKSTRAKHFLAPVDVEMLHLSPYNSGFSILINLLITINT